MCIYSKEPEEGTIFICLADTERIVKVGFSVCFLVPSDLENVHCNFFINFATLPVAPKFQMHKKNDLGTC